MNEQLSALKNFEKFQPSASNFKSFSRSLEQFFLSVVYKCDRVTWSFPKALQLNYIANRINFETTHDTVLNLSSEPRLELNELYYILYMLFGAFELKLKLPRT